MTLFRIVWKSSSEHDLRRIDKQHIPGILGAIESLAQDPFPVQTKKLTGSESTYRLRIGDYRVIYQVEPASKNITVYHIRHRRDVYKRFTRSGNPK